LSALVLPVFASISSLVSPMAGKKDVIEINEDKFTTFREEARSPLIGFHVGLLFWSNWNLDMLVLVEGVKP